MKLKRCSVFILSVLMFFIFTNEIEVKAMNTGFSIEELSEETKTTFVSNVNISPLEVEPIKRGVQCFDVNEQGLIAVGQKGSKGKEVCVYTPQGEFLYGYVFNCTQSFGIEWDGQHINIYFVRSDVIISLDLDGNILDIKAVQDTVNNNTYRNSLLYSTTRIVGDTTYLIKNDMGILNWVASSYSQIITIDAMGTECIIYDVNSIQLTKMIVIIVAVIVVIAIFAWKLFRAFMK